MRTFEFRVFIDRPPEEVFDFAVNPDNDHLWQENLISSEWITPEPAGVGSVKRGVTRTLGREVGAEVEYTAWDRPHGYAFKGAAGSFAFSGAAKFEGQAEGTLVTFAGRVEVSGILKLAEGLAGQRAEKQDRANYEQLKRVLEGD
jgi:carbon monoxide dehydrogenase subunit G